MSNHVTYSLVSKLNKAVGFNPTVFFLLLTFLTFVSFFVANSTPPDNNHDKALNKQPTIVESKLPTKTYALAKNYEQTAVLRSL